jgi:hypothetical protein
MKSINPEPVLYGTLLPGEAWASSYEVPYYIMNPGVRSLIKFDDHLYLDVTLALLPVPDLSSLRVSSTWTRHDFSPSRTVYKAILTYVE